MEPILEPQIVLKSHIIGKELHRDDVVHLEELFNLLPDIYFYVKNTWGRWVACNLASLRLLRAPAVENVINAREEDFFPPTVARAIRADDLSVLKRQARIVNRVELIANENGNLVWVTTNKLPIRDIEQNTIGLVGTTRLLRDTEELPGPYKEYRNIIKHVQENMGGEIRMQNLADIARLSQSQFRKRFKNQFGLSPQKFLLQTRLQTGSRMLLDTEKNISEIAFSCGFTDQSYFTRQFKNYFGVSPRQYKLRWR